jgi:hypothetical protein
VKTTMATIRTSATSDRAAAAHSPSCNAAAACCAGLSAAEIGVLGFGFGFLVWKLGLGFEVADFTLELGIEVLRLWFVIDYLVFQTCL